ncbi:MAG: EF-hand domain-containing protein [bacterium]|nr:EF-hand domain-containing protein [bacterium]
MISSIGSTNTTAAVAMTPPKRPSPEEMFAELDTDASGTLDETELQAMIDRMSGKMDADAPSASEMMSRLDTDGDGAVNAAELEAGRPQGPPPGAGGPPPAQEEASLLSEQLLELYSSSDEEKATLLQYAGVLA